MRNKVSLKRVNVFSRIEQGLHSDGQRQSNSRRLFYILGVYGASPSCYFSLLNRSKGLSMADMDAAIYRERRLIRMRCMRGSMFLVSSDDAPIAFQSTRKISLSAFQRLIEKSGVTEKDYKSTVELLTTLTQSQCLTVNELSKAISPEMKAVKRALNFIVAEMCSQGILVRAGVRGSWKSNLFEYTSFKNWVPKVNIESVTANEAIESLARRYLDTYGPATAQDFQWWSGLPKSETDQALRTICKEVVKLDVQGLTGEYLILQSDMERLLSCPEKLPSDVHLLPTWDAYMMAYKAENRIRYLSPECYSHIYDRSGNATSVVLTDGQVSGIWDMRIEKEEIQVLVNLFKDAGKPAWDRIKKEAEIIAEWLGFKKVCVFRCSLPPPLNQSPQNRFLSPLDGITGEAIS